MNRQRIETLTYVGQLRKSIGEVKMYPSRARSSVPSVPSKKTDGRSLRIESTDDSKFRFHFLYWMMALMVSGLVRSPVRL